MEGMGVVDLHLCCRIDRWELLCGYDIVCLHMELFIGLDLGWLDCVGCREGCHCAGCCNWPKDDFENCALGQEAGLTSSRIKGRICSWVWLLAPLLGGVSTAATASWKALGLIDSESSM